MKSKSVKMEDLQLIASGLVLSREVLIMISRLQNFKQFWGTNGSRKKEIGDEVGSSSALKESQYHIYICIYVRPRPTFQIYDSSVQ